MSGNLFAHFNLKCVSFWKVIRILCYDISEGCFLLVLVCVIARASEPLVFPFLAKIVIRLILGYLFQFEVEGTS